MPTLTRIECTEDRDAIIGVEVEKTSLPRDSPSVDVRLKATKRAPSFQGCKLLLKLMIDEDKNGLFLHPNHHLTSDLGSIQDKLYSGGEPPTPAEFCSLIRSTFESVQLSSAENKVKEEARRLLEIFESTVDLIDTPETRARHISVRFGMTGDIYFRNQISISSRKIQTVGTAQQDARFAAELGVLKKRFKEFDCKTVHRGNAVSNLHSQISGALARKSKINAKTSHVKGNGVVASNSGVDICMERLTQLGISNRPLSYDESSPFTLSPFVQAFRKIDKNLMTAKSGQEDAIGRMFYEHMKKFMMLNKEVGSDDMACAIHRVNGAVAAFEDVNNRLAQAKATDPDSVCVYMRGLCQIVNQLGTAFPLA